MKTAEVERLLRDHYRGEVAAARAHGGEAVRRRRRPWLTALATAAALALLPVFMVVGGPTMNPLASVIDHAWNGGGRARVIYAMLAVGNALDMPNTNLEE
jgi:hypothetical protein